MQVEDALSNIANNLKELRNKKGLTQLEVSHNLNMERRGYQKIEYNEVKNIRLSTILKILEYFKIDFNELIK